MLAAALYLNYYNKFQPPGFTHIVLIERVILKILNALNINKAYGYGDISVWLINLCSKSLVKLLSMIFKNCIDTNTFRDVWKRSNVIPVH